MSLCINIKYLIKQKDLKQVFHILHNVDKLKEDILVPEECDQNFFVHCQLNRVEVWNVDHVVVQLEYFERRKCFDIQNKKFRDGNRQPRVERIAFVDSGRENDNLTKIKKTCMIVFVKKYQLCRKK